MADAWIALATGSREVGWTSKLEGGPFSAWVKFLMTVKDRGQRGGCIRIEYLDSDWLEKNNVTLADWSTMLAAAIKDGAVKGENGVFTIANWPQYQRDQTGAERQKRWRENQDENDVTLRNGCNGDRTGQDRTLQDRTKNPLPPLLDVPQFRSVWADWLEYRKQARYKKYTPLGLKRLLNKLARWVGEYDLAAVVGCVNLSIENGWQGLFPPKPAGSKSSVRRKEGAPNRDIHTGTYTKPKRLSG